MKRLYALGALVLWMGCAIAQAPQSFKYQAVLRNADGTSKASKQVSLDISILQSSASGAVLYEESFDTTTNALGIINLNIGEGTLVSGSFTSIDWSAGPYFIRIGVDGTEMGTSQLLSVPFALYSEKSGNGFSGNYNDLTHKPDFEKWDKDSTDNINKPAASQAGDLLSYDGNNWIAKRILDTLTGTSGGSQPFGIRDPYLGLNFEIALVGIFPSRDMGADPYLGSIGIFAGNFAVKGWALCDGQLLSISQNTALFSLLGTTYGGNGQTTFALPDLRGRVPVHSGQGPGLSNIDLGQTGGSETQTLLISNMPAHNHTFRISYE
jgi:microcystin-dependent protein